jgi:hypothetical protein
LCSLFSAQCITNAQTPFPLLSEKTQDAIIADLSTAINNLAQASKPVGGDDETYWAASMVDSLYKVVTVENRPFLEQIATIHHMNSYFAYGMNYFSSVVGMYSCPEEAGYARYSVQVCDSLANNARVTGYKDIMAVADLSAYSYFYTQLYVTMLHKINGHKDFKDRDLGYPLQNLGLLRYAKEKGVFSENEIFKMYFVFDAVCFFKTYYGLIMSFTYSEEHHNSTHSILIDYAKDIDAISAPVFNAAYSEEYKGMMTDAEFEDIMLKLTDIKVNMMEILIDEFMNGPSTQQ